jgi:ribose 5-phosphate isomerase B
MKIYLGADHNGFELKAKLASFLERSGYEIADEGDVKLHPDDDFPQFASRVCVKLLDETADARGILICGSGQGMCMAANRFKGIRASLCWNIREARSSRNDDDSNVLCLSASSLDQPEAERIVLTWLSTPFAGAPRFKRRLQQLDNLG